MEASKRSGARQAALECLERSRRDGAWSGNVIDHAIKKYALDSRDAALVSRLTLGVLQNISLCDFYIDSFCRGKLEPKVRDILRSGIYQLLFMDKIPARAAVSESVELCRSLGYARAAGLVNAVLRRVDRERDKLPKIPGEGSAQYLSILYSQPLWLVEDVIERKGYEHCEAFLRENNSQRGLTIQVNRTKVSAQDYARALSRQDIAYVQAEGLDGCIELEGGAADKLPGFDEGLFYVQDRAARMAVEIAGPRPGMKVLDCCASPGGKSFAAAIAMEDQGSILSCDIHEKKLSLIRSGAERLGLDIISTTAHDARTIQSQEKDSYDLVIADVPCSGLGLLAKKPEIRFKSKEEIEGLPKIQLDILKAVSKAVKPGGLLLYSTCTILKEENEELVESFLSGNDEFLLEPFSVAGLNCPEGMHCFWPNIDGTDGFFAARLRRKI